MELVVFDFIPEEYLIDMFIGAIRGGGGPPGGGARTVARAAQARRAGARADAECGGGRGPVAQQPAPRDAFLRLLGAQPRLRHRRSTRTVSILV